MRAVVFDAMGVLSQADDDLRQLLIPLGRIRGTRLTDAEIIDIYRLASRGKFSAAELWRHLAITGDPAELDEMYLSDHELVPGIVDLLQDLRGQGVEMGCISNDLAEWSRALRERHGLDGIITHWTVSGEVGTRKPEYAIYESFLRSSGLAANACVFVDDRRANIAAAAELGFLTVLADFSGGSARAGRCCADRPGAEGGDRGSPGALGRPAQRGRHRARDVQPQAQGHHSRRQVSRSIDHPSRKVSQQASAVDAAGLSAAMLRRIEDHK